jgi:hypothetical protein
MLFLKAAHDASDVENASLMVGEEIQEGSHSERPAYMERRLAAQYAFIRFDTSAFCAADMGFRVRRLTRAPAVDAVGRPEPRLKSGNAL